MSKVQANPAALNNAVQLAVNNAIGGVNNIRKYTQDTCGELLNTSSHMENILPILGDDYIDFPMASAPTGLFPGVPIASQMMELSKIIEKGAVYEIARLNNPDLDAIVRQWIRILETHVGLSSRVEDLREDVAREKLKTVIRAVTIVLFQAKRREVGPIAPTSDGLHPRDALVATARGQITLQLGDDPAMRVWLREVCIEEQDEEEFNTIMRMMPQEPSSQGPAPQQNP